jgi:hypothetical protein
VRPLEHSGCRHVHGDITHSDWRHLIQQATHIYAFDVVFSRDTHRRLLPLIAAAPFKVFVCCRSHTQMVALVGVEVALQFLLVHKQQISTAGGKHSFTCYFYVRADSLSDSHPLKPLHTAHMTALVEKVAAKAAKAEAKAADQTETDNKKKRKLLGQGEEADEEEGSHAYG